MVWSYFEDLGFGGGGGGLEGFSGFRDLQPLSVQLPKHVDKMSFFVAGQVALSQALSLTKRSSTLRALKDSFATNEQSLLLAGRFPKCSLEYVHPNIHLP